MKQKNPQKYFHVILTRFYWREYHHNNYLNIRFYKNNLLGHYSRRDQEMRHNFKFLMKNFFPSKFYKFQCIACVTSFGGNNRGLNLRTLFIVRLGSKLQ